MDGANKRAALAAEAATYLESDPDLGGEESSGASGSGRVEWSGVEWSRRVNAPILTTGQN